MKTVFLAWQDRGASRRWFPIGRLDSRRPGEVHVGYPDAVGRYRFTYVKGAADAHPLAGLEPLDSFPDFHRTYDAPELFPLFKNRVMTPGRSDFPAYLRQLDLDPSVEPDPLEILAVTGGTRQTDSLEVFPKIERLPDGAFRCRFFLHGWRHVSEVARGRLDTLQPGEPLRVALELDNPATGLALQLQTPEDYLVLGWTPRYLVNDLVQAIANAPGEVAAHVVQVNPAPAPAQARLLVCLSARWPANYEPMSGPEFQPYDTTATIEEALV